jgi:heme O synthase-like polyprenyltransferase
MKNRYEINPEWTRQALVTYGGLIGVGVIVLQALISVQSLDLASLISIVSFAVAIPLLAVMVLVYHAQSQYRYATYPWYLTLIIVLGQGGAFLGVLAAFWHVSWIAGILLAASGVGGLVIYTVYLKQMERDNASPSPSGAANER